MKQTNGTNLGYNLHALGNLKQQFLTTITTTLTTMAQTMFIPRKTHILMHNREIKHQVSKAIKHINPKL